jgi:glucose-1-phosphate cytidylyltransferase
VSQAEPEIERPPAGRGPDRPRPPVAILCGGRGTRLQEHTQAIPKPLVEIGGMPIVWHVIQLYAVQGFRRFLLATGYKGGLIERFVAEHEWPEGVEVSCVDTGLETQTGGRIGRLASLLAEEPAFCATYADGVADIDLQGLLDFHDEHGAAATMTVVRPELQFGVTELDREGRVTGFREKPRSEHWINGGFFCFAARAMDYIVQGGDASVLERAPLEGLAADGELRAHRHEGFWECMDTYKDAVALNDLWASGRAPWQLWRERGQLAAAAATATRLPSGSAA